MAIKRANETRQQQRQSASHNLPVHMDQGTSGKSGSEKRGRRGNGQKQALGLSRSSEHRFMPTLFSPFSLLRRFGEDMEQIFEDFGFGQTTPSRFHQMSMWRPQVEMFEHDRKLVVRADLPGIKKDNVKVELRENALVIRGERREEHEEEREGFYRTERSYGNFYRELPLPEGVDTEKAEANFADGVLEITMPMRQSESRGRQLQIHDAPSKTQHERSK